MSEHFALRITFGFFYLLWSALELLTMWLSEARHYYKVRRAIPVTLLALHLFIGWYTSYWGTWFLITHVILAVLYKHWNSVPKTPKVDVTDQICVITGVAEGGIGFFAALKMLQFRSKVIIACRNVEAAESVKTILVDYTGNEKIEIRLLDVSSLKSVAEFVDGMIRDYKKIDMLINNAGGNFNPGELSVDGYELCWATNYLGQVALTEGLLPLLKKGRGRVVFTNSSAQERPTETHADDVNGRFVNGGYYSYCRSKLCLCLYTVDLQERLVCENSDVIVTSFHPGTCFTPIWSKSIPHHLYFLVEYYFALRMRSAEDGAETAVFLATSDDKSHGGKYFYSNQVHPYNPIVHDSKERSKLNQVTLNSLVSFKLVKK
jgi:NAD(P)-dependent dehydrogenase (short-subunit alcohol dehydrogenase family)